MNDDIKEVHTGLYSDKAFKLLSHIVAAQIEERSWGSIRSQFNSMNVERAADGEVIFTLDQDHKSYYCNSIWNKPNNEALKWIAIYIKQFVRNYSSCWVNGDLEDIDWNRDNNYDKVKFVVDTKCYSINDKKMFRDMFNGKEGKSSVTAPIHEIYFIYDKFMFRKGLEKKYPSKMIDAYIGRPNDPITTEIELAKRQDFKNLKDELNKDLNLLDEEFDKEERVLKDELDEKIEELEEKIDKKRQERKQQYEAELAKLRKSYGMPEQEAA